MLRKNMRQEMITEEELLAQLRQQGVEDMTGVKKCYLEGDGRISVIELNLLRKAQLFVEIGGSFALGLNRSCSSLSRTTQKVLTFSTVQAL